MFNEYETVSHCFKFAFFYLLVRLNIFSCFFFSLYLGFLICELPPHIIFYLNRLSFLIGRKSWYILGISIYAANSFSYYMAFFSYLLHLGFFGSQICQSFWFAQLVSSYISLLYSCKNFLYFLLGVLKFCFLTFMHIIYLEFYFCMWYEVGI